MATTIVPELKYIGVDDYDLGLFESQYPAPKGITYNSYLILDERSEERRVGKECGS